MAEAHQARMQNVVEEMVQSLERDHIRKMQVGFYESFGYYMYWCYFQQQQQPRPLCVFRLSCRVVCSAAVPTAVVAPQTPCLRFISA